LFAQLHDNVAEPFDQAFPERGEDVVVTTECRRECVTERAPDCLRDAANKTGDKLPLPLDFGPDLLVATEGDASASIFAGSPLTPFILPFLSTPMSASPGERGNPILPRVVSVGVDASPSALDVAETSSPIAFSSARSTADPPCRYRARGGGLRPSFMSSDRVEHSGSNVRHPATYRALLGSPVQEAMIWRRTPNDPLTDIASAFSSPSGIARSFAAELRRTPTLHFDGTFR
jgi:hypothetical protein